MPETMKFEQASYQTNISSPKLRFSHENVQTPESMPKYPQTKGQNQLCNKADSGIQDML